MKKNANQIGKQVLILLIAPIIGLFALLLVHLLPTEIMKDHVYWSLSMIEQEFTDEVLVDGFPSTLSGNFTDSLMLHYAIYNNEEHNILEQSIRMYRTETYNVADDPEGWWPGQSLKDYLEGVPQGREIEYSRYWHGYLVILKPLLLLTTFNSIRLLNSALQLFLVGYIVMMLSQKGEKSTAMAYLFSLPFMFYVSTYASLSLSICFYLVNLAVLFQLKKDQQLYNTKSYGMFFLVVGICTAYFDFLTYPIVTLAYSLCFYFIFHKDRLKSAFIKLIQYSLEWCIGYVCMWASKWILTDIIFRSGLVKEAINKIMFRTQSVESVSRVEGFIDVILLHVQPFANWCYLLLILFLFVSVAKKIFHIGNFRSIGQMAEGVIFFIIALYPFVWMFVIQNHSVHHWQFTCRIMSVTVFAGVLGINKLIDEYSDKRK